MTIQRQSDFFLESPSPFLLEGATLFLDLDGTLLELVDRPEDVVADDCLRDLLRRLSDRLEGRLAIVSGRSIAQLDGILGDAAEAIAISGSHGAEHRWRGISAQPVRPPALDQAVARLRPFAEARPGVLVEEKSYGVALHYRMLPDSEDEAQALVAELALELGLHRQDGKLMAELRLPGGDKGTAVRRLMSRPPMTGTRPFFIGDDITDEDGFKAAHTLGGAGILVGAPRQTAAIFGLPDPAAVRDWLEQAAA